MCDWRQLKEISGDDDIKSAKGKVSADRKDLQESLIDPEQLRRPIINF
jgi:hypothetical protein